MLSNHFYKILDHIKWTNNEICSHSRLHNLLIFFSKISFRYPSIYFILYTPTYLQDANPNYERSCMSFVCNEIDIRNSKNKLWLNLKTQNLKVNVFILSWHIFKTMHLFHVSFEFKRIIPKFYFRFRKTLYQEIYELRGILYFFCQTKVPNSLKWHRTSLQYF